MSTANIHSKLRLAFHQRFHLKTSSKHKETNPGKIIKHMKNVDALKAKLDMDMAISKYSSTGN